MARSGRGTPLVATPKATAGSDRAAAQRLEARALWRADPEISWLAPADCIAQARNASPRPIGLEGMGYTNANAT